MSKKLAKQRNFGIGVSYTKYCETREIDYDKIDPKSWIRGTFFAPDKLKKNLLINSCVLLPK
jgi:hypothetical protein